MQRITDPAKPANGVTTGSVTELAARTAASTPKTFS
jgi:hypothetical protein